MSARFALGVCTPSGRTRSLNGSPLLALLHHCSPRAWSIHPQTRLLRLHCIPKHIHFSPPPPAVSTETMRDLLTRMCLPASLCAGCLPTHRPTREPRLVSTSSLYCQLGRPCARVDDARPSTRRAGCWVLLCPTRPSLPVAFANHS